MSLTLWTKDEARGAHELKQVAHAVESELKRVPGTRNVYTIGGPDETVQVSLDAQRLAGHGLTIPDLVGSLQAANVVQHAGSLVTNGRRHAAAGGAVPGLARRRRAADRRGARRPSGLPAGRRGREVRRRPAGAVRDFRRRPGRVTEGHRIQRRLAGRHDRRLEEAGRERHRRDQCRPRAHGAPARHLHPGRCRGHRHPQLRRDRQRQGRQADPEADVRHGIGRAAGVAGPSAGARP